MDNTKALADVPATTLKTITSLIIDAASLAIAAYLTHLALTLTNWPPTLIWVITTALTAALILTWSQLKSRHGTSPGHAILGLRAASRHTYLPPRWPGLRAVDIRKGADPLCPTPRPITLDLAPRLDPPPSAELKPAFLATLDDGAQYQLFLPCVLGRNPRAAAGAHKLAITDLQRTISRTHLALWQEGTALVIQDLGSRGGTALRTPTGETSVLPHERLQVSLFPGVVAELRLGRRILRLEAIPTHSGAR